MEFTKTELNDVLLIEPIVHGDDRGFFLETWQKREFAAHGIDMDFVQDNHSKSSNSTLRGLHYQIQQPQGKLARVIAGEVFDVVIDLRKSSSTFGKWTGLILSAENKRMLWAPPGFAHGFYVISASAEFAYKCTDYYAPKYERSIIWSDRDLGIEWPSDVKAPLLSEKDAAGVAFADAEYFP